MKVQLEKVLHRIKMSEHSPQGIVMIVRKSMKRFSISETAVVQMAVHHFQSLDRRSNLLLKWVNIKRQILTMITLSAEDLFLEALQYMAPGIQVHRL